MRISQRLIRLAAAEIERWTKSEQAQAEGHAAGAAAQGPIFGGPKIFLLTITINPINPTIRLTSYYVCMLFQTSHSKCNWETDTGYTPLAKSRLPVRLPGCPRVLPVADLSSRNHAVTTHALEADKARQRWQMTTFAIPGRRQAAGGRQQSRRSAAAGLRHHGRHDIFRGILRLQAIAN